jgi:hypothetical protein
MPCDLRGRDLATIVLKIGFVLILFCSAASPQLIPSDAAKVSPAQTRMFLEMICPGNAVETGCSVCPDGTGFAGIANWKLEAITFGHFLAPGSQDALISGSDCESHADGLSGSYLFTKAGSAWSKYWYSPGQNTSDCKKFPGSDGRDFLICGAHDMHQGAADWFLYLVDAGQDPAKRDDDALDIFFAVDDTLGGCVKFPDGTVEAGKIDSVSFAPASAEFATRITVTAHLGKAVVPDKALVACVFSQPGAPQIATRALQFRFTFGGQSIVPDPANPPMQYGTAVAPVTSYSVSK